MDETPANKPQAPNRPIPVDRLLRGMGIVLFALCAFSGVARLVPSFANPDESKVGMLGALSAHLAVGIAMAGICFGLAAMLRHLESLHAALIRVEKYQYEIGARQAGRPASEPALEASPGDTATSPGRPQSTAGDDTLPLFDTGFASPAAASPSTAPLPREPHPGAPPWQELIQVLQDIRDNSLLSDKERSEKRTRVEELDFTQTAEAVRALAIDGDYSRVRQLIEGLRARHLDSARVDGLVDEIESQRERFESRDISQVTKQVEDLMTISAWQRAREVVQQLQERHPDSAEARQLLLRLERENKLVQDEQRRRMHAEVQRFVSRKRWEEALVAARTFIERFPGCAESEALLMQVPTLEANAEIEVRQDLEARIMDFVKHGRYIEAAALARMVIDRYPDSPQADALRSQLGRLEQLANDPDAPPARVRIE